jgi:metal-responsive CopG/Arc/MetJ family transcriptional regulator
MICGMNRSVKVAISLPEDLLSQVDRVRRRSGESRSQYFRDAAAARLTSRTESSVEAYRRGYVGQPETASEIEAATRSAVALLASEPWE